MPNKGGTWVAKVAAIEHNPELTNETTWSGG